MKKTNINLMESYSIIEKRKSSKSDRVLVLTLLLVGIVLVMGAFSIKLFLESIYIKNEIKTVTAYINSPQIIERIEVIDRNQKRITDLNEIDKILTELNASFNVIPRINTLTLNMITSNMPAGTSLKSINFNGQWFTIFLNSPDYSKPSEFANRLNQSGYFEEVVYSGYTTETVGGLPRFVGKVVAILKVGE